MNLKMKWPLQSPEDSTGAPSAAPPASSESSTPPASAPASAPVHIELPDIGTQGANEDTNVDGDDSSIDWAAESTPASEDPDITGDEPPPPPAPPAAPPKAPAQPPAAKQPPAAAQPPAPPPTEEPAQPPTDATPPAAETPEQKTARELAEKTAREKVEQEQFAQLTEYYKIPDDLAAKLATEPELVLPVLAAKIHQALMRTSMNMLAQELPQRIQQINAYHKAEEESKTAFYTRWPGLKGHERHVLQVGAMYRQMNPKATPEQAIEKIGQVVNAALGLTADPPPAPGAPAKGVPPAPPAAKAGFRPAGTQQSAAAATPPSDNIFTQLAEEFLAEDRQ